MSVPPSHVEMEVSVLMELLDTPVIVHQDGLESAVKLVSSKFWQYDGTVYKRLENCVHSRNLGLPTNYQVLNLPKGITRLYSGLEMELEFSPFFFDAMLFS